LYGCEAWCPKLREEQRLTIVENGKQRRIFEPKRDEIIEGCRKLHNEELHTLRQI
jgi:hypothetical protein